MLGAIFLTEGWTESLSDGLGVIADWLDVCFDQLICCCSQNNHLAGLPLLFLLH